MLLARWWQTASTTRSWAAASRESLWCSTRSSRRSTSSQLARALVGDLDPVDPRVQLQTSLDRARADVDAEDRPAHDELAARADDALVTGVDSAFAPAFVICGVLALLGAWRCCPADRRA